MIDDQHQNMYKIYTDPRSGDYYRNFVEKILNIYLMS